MWFERGAFYPKSKYGYPVYLVSYTLRLNEMKPEAILLVVNDHKNHEGILCAAKIQSIYQRLSYLRTNFERHIDNKFFLNLFSSMVDKIAAID